MAIDKFERLMNLTMALLASKKYLSKKEIYSSVAGYEIEADTQSMIDSRDRMFERDKDDLRSLGIEVSVGNHDPFFDDELGYRISPENYYLPEVEFSPIEYSIINLAMSFWRGSSWEKQAQSVGIKLNSPELNRSIDPNLDPFFNEYREFMPQIFTAISDSKTIQFLYPSEDLNLRTVEPMKLYVSFGQWYLLGYDVDREDFRRFKLQRILAPILITSKKFSGNKYENLSELVRKIIPEDFDIVLTFTHILQVDGEILNQYPNSVKKSENLYEISFSTIDQAIIWTLENISEIKVLSPQWFIDEIANRVNGSSHE